MTLDRTIAPPIRQIDHFSISTPERTIMPNGTPLNIIQVGSEDVVRLDLLIKGGQWNQTQPLLAMLPTACCVEGTRSLSSSQIAEKTGLLWRYGLDLSSSVNYGFVTLYSLGKYFPKTIEILASMVKEPVFPEKELSVVVDVNKQQFLVNAQRVDVMARKRLNRALFGLSHPLGRYAELEDYDRINSEVLKGFYHQYYHSGNCSVYVSGKVSPEVIHCIKQHFGESDWGDTTRKIKNETLFLQQKIANAFCRKEDALQSSIKIGTFSINQQHPDYLKLRVLVTLFGGYFGSRLMSNIREDKGYTYGIGAGLVNYPNTGVLGISTEAANEYVEPLIAEVYKEMDILCSEKVSDEELDMVRNYMLGDMCRSYESAFSLSDAWIFIETSGLKNDFFDHTLKAIREVTSDELQALAQKYFCKENLIAVDRR